MKTLTIVMLAILPVMTATMPAPATAQIESKSTIDGLSWLAGCWGSLDGEVGSGEQWSIPAGGTMLGTSRAVRGGETVGHEFLMIREIAGGRLEYVALPSGQEGATFDMVAMSDGDIVFENLEHDFPQRIIYRLVGATQLEAKIEGVIDGELQSVVFVLERVACAD